MSRYHQLCKTCKCIVCQKTTATKKKRTFVTVRIPHACCKHAFSLKKRFSSLFMLHNGIYISSLPLHSSLSHLFAPCWYGYSKMKEDTWRKTQITAKLLTPWILFSFFSMQNRFLTQLFYPGGCSIPLTTCIFYKIYPLFFWLYSFNQATVCHCITSNVSTGNEFD